MTSPLFPKTDTPFALVIYGPPGAGKSTLAEVLAMPEARGLFSAAAVQSGSLLNAATAEEAVGLAEKLLQRLGLGAGVWQGLQDAPWPQLVEAQQTLGGGMGRVGVVPQHPGWVLRRPARRSPTG